jgi:hypothetical protein
MGDVSPLRYMLDKNRANKKEKKERLRDWKTKIEIQRDWESEKDKESLEAKSSGRRMGMFCLRDIC